jgi:hypothetical protein
MGRIKCVKMHCPICQIIGTAQLFLNKKSESKYARIRHYKGLNEFKKPQFEYHKIEDPKTLKTLLLNKGISLSTDEANSGQISQRSSVRIRDPELEGLSLISKIKGAGSSVRIEHHPPKVGVVGSNPTSPVNLCEKS